MDGALAVFREVISKFWHRTQQGCWQVLLLESPRDQDRENLWAPFRDTALAGEVCTFDGSDCPGGNPFGPFLSYLNKKSRGLKVQEIDRLLSKARVYPPHREIFRSFLTTGIPCRREDLLLAPAEVRYERREMTASIRRLLSVFSQERPLVFLISRLDLAAPSVFRFLKDVLDHGKSPGKVLILGAYPSQGEAPGRQASWLTLISTAEAGGNLLVLPSPTVLPLSEDSRSLGLTLKETLNTARLAQIFLAWEDGIQALENARPPVDTWAWDGGRLEAQELWGDLYLQAEAYDKALMVLEQTLIQYQKQKDTPAIARIWQSLALLFFRKKDLSQAERAAEQALKLARIEGDQELCTRNLAVKVYIWEQGHGQWPQIKQEFEELLVQLKAMGWANLLSQFESLGTYVKALFDEHGWDKAWGTAQKALTLSQKNRNRYRTSVALHTLGFVQEYAGKVDNVLGYFQKAIRLRQGLKDPLELIKVFNGAGYFCFSRGAFAQALVYFEKALGFLRTSREYVEICLTLFNVSLVYFYSHHWNEALKFLEDVLGIMDDLELDEIPWHSRAKLYALAGITAFHKDNRAKGLYYHHRALERKPSPGDSPILSMLEGLLNSLTDPNGRGIRLLEASQSEARAHHQSYLVLEASYQLSLMHRQLGQTEASIKVWKEAWALGEAERAQVQLDLLKDLEQSGSLQEPPPRDRLRLIHFDSGTLREVAKQEANLNQLHRKLGEIHFLHALQSRSFTSGAKEEFLPQLMELLRNNTLASRVYFISENSSLGRRVEWSFPQDDFPFNPVDELKGLFAVMEPLLLGPGNPQLPSVLTSLIYLPLMGEEGVLGRILCATDNTAPLLTDSDLQLLSLASSQISMALELKTANERLILAATVDSLTGTLTRQELLKRLDLEHKRLFRSPVKGSAHYSLIFLDLDNFKYINDTYGHQAGDTVLRSFAHILRECTRDIDLVGRYGGDEFILVLPETSGAGARIVAGRILQKIRQGRFIEDLSHDLRIRVQIPPGRDLSCSAGITVADGLEELEVFQVLARADSALYKAKNAGKNQMVLS